jgi:3-oxoacyl-[acyl-carrier protein] reductase
MMERRWGRIVNITSQSVKAPIPALGLSNSARAGLTGYVAGTSRQVAQRGDDQQPPARHPCHRPRRRARRERARQKNISVEEARSGTPSDDPRPPLRHGGGVRRHVRLPLLGTRASSWGRTSCSTAGAVNSTL